MPSARTLPPLLALSIALVACSPGAEGDATGDPLGTELAADRSDPLLAAVVQDPLMTDPQLSTRSNADAIRPPSQPYAAAIPTADVAPAPPEGDGELLAAPKPDGACPVCRAASESLTLAALAARQTDAATRRCASALRYGAGWANSLPADLRLPDAARVVEAAGADTDGCRLRAVSYTIARPLERMADWYFTQASRAGYASTHRADSERQVLSGTRAQGGNAYTVVLRDAGAGTTAIDIVAAGG